MTAGRGSSVASTTSSAGSRRNHVFWRFANCSLWSASRAIASFERPLPVEERPVLAVADRGEGRQGRVEPVAQAPCLLDQARGELLARARLDPAPVLARVHDELYAEGRRPVAEWLGRRLVAAERRDLQRPDDAARVGRSVPAATQWRGPLQPRRQRLEAVSLRAASSSSADRGVVRQGVGVDARHDRAQPEARPADEDPDAAPPPERHPRRRGRASGSRRPCMARRARRGRCSGGRRVPAPRASPWPSRCRGRGRPASKSTDTVLAGVPGRAGEPRRRWRGRSCLWRSGRRGRSAGRAPRDPRARVLRRRPGSGERAPGAYGPPCATRTRTSPPTSEGAPATWTSLPSRERPARWATPSGRCANTSRTGSCRLPPRRHGHGCAAGRRCRRSTSVSRPTQARYAATAQAIAGFLEPVGMA